MPDQLSLREFLHHWRSNIVDANLSETLQNSFLWEIIRTDKSPPLHKPWRRA